MALPENVFLAMNEDPLLLPIKEENRLLSKRDPYSMVQFDFNLTEQSNLGLKIDERYPLAELEGERYANREDPLFIPPEAEPNYLPLQIEPLHVQSMHVEPLHLENPDARLNSDLWIVPNPWDASEGWNDVRLRRSQRVNWQEEAHCDPEERDDLEQWIVPEQHDVLDGPDVAASRRTDECPQLNGRAARLPRYPVVRLTRLTQAELSAARLDHRSPHPRAVSGSRDCVVRFLLKSGLSTRLPARLQAVPTHGNGRTSREETSNQAPGRARCQTSARGPSRAVGTSNDTELDLHSILNRPESAEESYTVLHGKKGVTQVPRQARLQTPVSSRSKAVGTNNYSELDLRSQISASEEKRSSALHIKKGEMQVPGKARLQTPVSSRSAAVGTNDPELDPRSQISTSAEKSSSALEIKEGVMRVPGQASLQTSVSSRSKAVGTSNDSKLDKQSQLSTSVKESNAALCRKEGIMQVPGQTKMPTRRSGRSKPKEISNRTELDLRSLPKTSTEESNTALRKKRCVTQKSGQRRLQPSMSDPSKADGKSSETGLAVQRPTLEGDTALDTSTEQSDKKLIPVAEEGLNEESSPSGIETHVCGAPRADVVINKTDPSLGSLPSDIGDCAKESDTELGSPLNAWGEDSDTALGSPLGGNESDSTSVRDTECTEGVVKKVSTQIGVPITRRKRTKRPKKENTSAKRKRSKIVPKDASMPRAEAAEKEARHRAALDERRSNVVVIPAELEKSVDVHWRRVGADCYACNMCPHVTATEVKVVGHVRNHLDVRPFGCKLCPATFCSRGMAVRHGEVHNKLYSCGFCSHRFKGERALRDHENLHKDVRPYQCKVCDANFHALANLRIHVARIHKEVRERIVCEECGRSYGTVNLLKKHLCMHHERKRIVCQVCQKELHFTSLKTHMFIHNNQTLTCDVCSKSFISRERLSRHIQTVHADAKLECPECGKKYKSRQFLEDHILTHQGIRRHCCPVCGKTFSTRANFETHKFVHLGKNFVCHVCGAKFNRNDNMKSHIKRMHVDGKDNEKKPVVRAFRCSDCEKSFVTNKQLKDHLISHDERYSTCDVCSKSYLSKKKLIKHIESAHNVRASP